MPGPFLTRENELFVQQEATYGVSPGALAGTDAFKHTSKIHVTREIERYVRDRDADNAQASVFIIQKGREKSKVSIEADLIPSGNASSPTEPDIDVLLMCGFGSKHKATAHTTTAAGSSGVTLNLTPGGGAASGILANDLIAVDVDGTFGYEVRRVIGIATDVVTVDRAFSANPAAARTVKVGTTYKLLNTAQISAYLWRFNGNDLRYAVPGFGVQEVDLAIAYSEGAPVGRVKFSGEAKPQVTQATSRPTPTTAGIPLVPTLGKTWIGATKYSVISANVNLKNGIELRTRESDALVPNGLKRTGNSSHYDVSQALDLYATDVTKPLYDNAPSLGLLDVLVQLGDTPGKIVAWHTPGFVPDGDETEQEGEVGYRLSGRCIAAVNDGELFLGFI